MFSSPSSEGEDQPKAEVRVKEVFKKNLRTVFFIFLTAFTARVIFYFAFRKIYPNWNFEALEVNDWLEIARNLAAGSGYSNQDLLTYFPTDTLHPTAARSPLPVLAVSGLILLFGNQYAPLFIYSWILSGLSAVLLYSLGLQLLPSRKWALAAALFFCFYFPEMYLSMVYAAASEGLFTFLFLSYLLIALRDNTKLSFFAGILLGLAFLCRPVVLFLPPLYAGWLFMRHRFYAVKPVLLFLAGFILIASPWAIRNEMVFGKPVLTTTLGGYNLLRHNFSLAENRYTLSEAGDFDPYARKIVKDAGHDLKKLNEAELDAIFKKKAKEIIRRYPDRYLKLCMIRLGWLWYKIGAEKPAYLIQNIFLYLFMLPGIVLAFVRRGAYVFLALHIFYFVLLHAAINAQFRFMAPVMPLGIILAIWLVARFSCQAGKDNPY